MTWHLIDKAVIIIIIIGLCHFCVLHRLCARGSDARGTNVAWAYSCSERPLFIIASQAPPMWTGGGGREDPPAAAAAAAGARPGSCIIRAGQEGARRSRAATAMLIDVLGPLAGGKQRPGAEEVPVSSDRPSDTQLAWLLEVGRAETTIPSHARTCWNNTISSAE